jgi:glycine cleavage system H protein
MKEHASMSDPRYTEEHEWVRMDGDVAVVGISAFAQEQLGDVVFVELPEPGKQVARGDEAAVVESVKAASELYAPISGTVVAVNDALAEDPSLVNSDPAGKGWFLKIRPSDPAELDGLMDEAAYRTFVAGQG